MAEGISVSKHDINDSIKRVQVDMTNPETVVQVEVDVDRGVLYVSLEGYTALRVCRGKYEVVIKKDGKEVTISDDPVKGKKKLTINQSADLRQAWQHIHLASEALNKCHLNMGEVNGHYIGSAQKEMSDARRLIDRVETGRAP